MTDRGLICSERTVLAFLAGATQDRRPVKPQPTISEDGYRWQWKGKELGTNNPIRWLLDSTQSPYGVPGDRLYVRENFAIHIAYNDCAPSEVPVILSPAIWYPAGGQSRGDLKDEYRGRERPSVHMPRRASRITLLVQRVWVERVKDISEADAVAGGVIPNQEYWDNAGEEKLFDCPSCEGFQVFSLGSMSGATEVDCEYCDTAEKRFGILWESTYGPGKDWCWCAELERVEK